MAREGLTLFEWSERGWRLRAVHSRARAWEISLHAPTVLLELLALGYLTGVAALDAEEGARRFGARGLPALVSMLRTLRGEHGLCGSGNRDAGRERSTGTAPSPESARYVVTREHVEEFLGPWEERG